MLEAAKEITTGVRITFPTKSLYQGKRYTSASNTDIRRTFEVAQRLIRMKQRSEK